MKKSAEKISPVVLKFGGSSVAEIKHWKTIVERLKLELAKDRVPVLVLSALKDVSNTLEGILHLAKSGDFQNAIDQLLEKHTNFAKQLDLSVESQLNHYGQQLAEYSQEIYKKQSITPRMHAKVLAIGELMSTTIGHAFIGQSGVAANWYDARELLVAERQPDQWHHFTSAVCNFEYSSQLSKQLFSPSNDASVVVTQGFIASDEQGNTVLLGREGSDTTAAYLAAKLGANELQIWTDVTGVFSANPADVSTALQIDKLSYAQATNQISLSVRSTWFPKHHGTQISSSDNLSDGPLAVTMIPRSSILKIEKSSHRAAKVSQILAQIAELGFDILLRQSDERFEQIALKYTNTDTPIPTVTDLVRDLKIQPDNLFLKGDLLSIIGSRENSSWMTSASAVVQRICGPSAELQLISQEEGRISFYVDNSVSNMQLKEIHDKLFAA
jgi:aspartokinase